MDSQIFTKAVEAGSRLTVKSALNPILWLCAIVSIPTLLISAWKDLPTWMAVIGFSPIVAAIFGFIILVFKNPDKLQSEHHQQEMRKLDLIEQKGDPKAYVVGVETLVTNPRLKAIEEAEVTAPTSYESIENDEER